MKITYYLLSVVVYMYWVYVIPSRYGWSSQLVVPREYVWQPQTVPWTIHGTAEGPPRTICGAASCPPCHNQSRYKIKVSHKLQESS